MSSKDYVEFLAKIRRIQSIMVQVTTGKGEVSKRKEEYSELYDELVEDFKLFEVPNPNDFRSLSDFYAYCHFQFKTYAERRTFVKNLYKSVEGIEDKTHIAGRTKRVFPHRDFEVQQNLCFVLMPFRSNFNRLHHGHIKPVLEKAGFEVLRADDIYTPSVIIEDIWEYINKARFIVADVTGRNPNVFYELGISHTLGKETVILTQNDNDVPFDLRHRRYFKYDDDENGWKSLRITLEKVASSLKSEKADNPFSDRNFGEINKEVSVEVSKAPVDFDSFDRSVKNLAEATQPKTTATLLSEFQPKLNSLCYDYEWSDDDVRERIIRVLNLIPEELSSNPNVSQYLQHLGMIVNRYGEYTSSVIKKRFLAEIERISLSQKLENSAKALDILQKLHGHSKDYLMKLVDYAAYRWDEKRFEGLSGAIEFWGLRERDEEGYQRILSYMRQKMEDAERNKDDEVYSRLERLYSQATR